MLQVIFDPKDPEAFVLAMAQFSSLGSRTTKIDSKGIHLSRINTKKTTATTTK